MVRVMEVQQQLGQLQEERQAFQEIKEMKTPIAPQRNAKDLELELEKSKDSERKMLESLASQTKQLEQTKISLEEAKLEIRSLQESIRMTEVSAGHSSRDLKRHGSLGMAHTQPQEEIRILRTELRSALEAEEKSRTAMDALALALREVTMEANQAKERLSRIQLELESLRTEAERMKASAESSNEKLRAAMEESKRLKLEAEEANAGWIEKENGFINFMKMSEEEIAETNQESSRLIDLLRSAREENSRMRDIVKQAVNEATVVKEALEIARNENSTLKDILSDKENALQSIKQENECIKVSEAAALDSIKELQSLLTATTSTMDSSNAPRRRLFEHGSFPQTKTAAYDEVKKSSSKTMATGCWRVDNTIKSKEERRYSIGESGRFEGSIFDMVWSPEPNKEQKAASFDHGSDLSGHSSLVSDNVSLDLVEHDAGSPMGSPMRMKKKRQILRKFESILRRGSFHK